jgi:hypothetical protein
MLASGRQQATEESAQYNEGTMQIGL